MKMKYTRYLIFIIFIFIIFIQFSCRASEEFKVIHQVTGPIKTNCYLIYGTNSKEAALIDPGGAIDTLTAFITDNKLKLKYVFVTHGHIDHVSGIPDIRKLFPKVKLCMHKDEYRDLFTQKDWAIRNYGPGWLAEVESNPETAKFLVFDMNSLGQPDIFVENNQVFRMGAIDIIATHSPGHSPGGICYSTGDRLFSGDVLFYRTVGRTDTQNGSREEQIISVRRLYGIFHDSTVVYPGHGQFTDIGSEKMENKKVSMNDGDWIKK